MASEDAGRPGREGVGGGGGGAGGRGWDRAEEDGEARRRWQGPVAGSRPSPPPRSRSPPPAERGTDGRGEAAWPRRAQGWVEGRLRGEPPRDGGGGGGEGGGGEGGGGRVGVRGAAGGGRGGDGRDDRRFGEGGGEKASKRSRDDMGAGAVAYRDGDHRPEERGHEMRGGGARGGGGGGGKGGEGGSGGGGGGGWGGEGDPRGGVSDRRGGGERWREKTAGSGIDGSGGLNSTSFSAASIPRRDLDSSSAGAGEGKYGGGASSGDGAAARFSEGSGGIRGGRSGGSGGGDRFNGNSRASFIADGDEGPRAADGRGPPRPGKAGGAPRGTGRRAADGGGRGWKRQEVPLPACDTRGPPSEAEGGPRRLDPYNVNDMLTKARTVAQIAAVCEETHESFDAVNVATAVHRLSRVSQCKADKARSASLWAGLLAGAAIAFAPKLRPPGVAALMLGLARLGIRPAHELLTAISRRTVETIENFHSQGIANVLWALASLGIQPERELLAALSRRGVALAGVSTPQNIANILWAHARLGLPPATELLDGMVRRALDIQPDFNEQNIANSMWALAKLKLDPGPEFREAMTRRAVAIKEQLYPQVSPPLKWTSTRSAFLNPFPFHPTPSRPTSLKRRSSPPPPPIPPSGSLSDCIFISLRLAFFLHSHMLLLPLLKINQVSV